MNKISLFLDSGAHSIYTKELINKQHKEGYDFYESEEFINYVDKYAAFIKKHKKYIDIYVNVDAIFNPEKSYDIQKYLEKKHKLRPLPVVHFGSDLKWIEFYINKKYDYIGLGGLGQEVTRTRYINWADDVFEFICDTPDRKPMIKTHGFAMTSLKLILRYPWYSVDSTSWVMTSRFGSVYIPKIRKGKYIYDESNWKVCVSDRSPSTKEAGKHITSFSPPERKIIKQYFKEKGYVLGKSEFFKRSKDYELQENEKFVSKADKNGIREVEKIIEAGLSNDYKLRDEMNIIYFMDLEKYIPEWPWAYKKKSLKGFGV